MIVSTSDSTLNQKERYDSTQVPLSQVFTPDNRSVADVSGDASADMSTGSNAYGATYGPNAYSADNSVAPVSVALSPTIIKGASSQTSLPSASQSGSLSWSTILAIGIPVAAFFIVKHLAKRNTSSTTYYIEYPWW